MTTVALLLALAGSGAMLTAGAADLVTVRTLAAVTLLSSAGLLMAAGRLPRIRSILVATGALMGPTGVTYLLVTAPEVADAPGTRMLGLICAVLTTLAAFALTSLAPSSAPAVVLRTYPTASGVMLAAGVVIATPALDMALGGDGTFVSAERLSGIAVLFVLALGLPWLGWFAVRVETWRAVAVSGTDAVMILGRSGRVESVDTGTERLTGWRASELRGMDLATLIHDGNTDLHLRLDEVASTMRASVMDERPLRLSGPMGSEVDVSMRLLPTITADGLRIIVTLTDAGREAEYRRRAFQDPLTGVLNRRGLLAELDRELRERSSRTAVMFVDLDHFKQINDLASHAAGDEALRHVATSLQNSVRAGDRVGRVGGDEFVCVLSGIRGDGDLLAAAERLEAELLKLTIDTVQGPIGITVSIGAAIAGPACTSDTLLARADAALLEAKRTGRNRIVVAGRSGAGPTGPEHPGAGHIVLGDAGEVLRDTEEDLRDTEEDRVVVDARTGAAGVVSPMVPARSGEGPNPGRRASTDPSHASHP